MQISGQKVVALPDAFCLYNRARGYDFVAPDLLLKICRSFGENAGGLHFKQLTSGLLVVLDASNADEVLFAKIHALLATVPFVSCASEELLQEMNPILLQDILLSMEMKGMLVRDESIHGIRYYNNHFFPIG